MKIGKLLVEQRSDRKLASFLASRLSVTTRTLRNWRAQAETGEAARIGRPAYSLDLIKTAKRKIETEMELQGDPGWRPIAVALPEVPTCLVQRIVGQTKAAKRKRERIIRARTRISTRVHAREAIWTMDGTMTNGRTSSEAQVIKDRGSLAYRAVRIGACANSRDVKALLTSVKSMTGLPLVLSTDNGSIAPRTPKNCSHTRKSYICALCQERRNTMALRRLVSARLKKQPCLAQIRTLHCSTHVSV